MSSAHCHPGRHRRSDEKGNLHTGMRRDTAAGSQQLAAADEQNQVAPVLVQPTFAA